MQPRLRKVGSAEFTRAGEAEHARVDNRAKRFNGIPHKRISPVLRLMQKAELENEAARGQCAREPRRFHHVGIIEHGVDWMRGVVAASAYALLKGGSASPALRIAKP